MTFREWLLTLLDRWRPAPTPAPVPKPPPRPLPAPAPADAVNAAMLALHNTDRAKLGIVRLAPNDKLAAVARRTVDDCAAHRNLSHTTSDGKDAAERISEAGYAWSWCGENLDEGPSTPAGAFAAWLASPPHRANILNPQFTEAGFATATDSNGMTYWCADFGRPASLEPPTGAWAAERFVSCPPPLRSPS
jgi:uncharacterized protein YkwD